MLQRGPISLMVMALTISAAARSAQPPDPVMSDGLYNTAAGTDVLLSNTTGVANTAMGAQAMKTNTQGQYNAAFGAFAMLLNDEPHLGTKHCSITAIEVLTARTVQRLCTAIRTAV
jgi:hypothetical protein